MLVPTKNLVKKNLKSALRDLPRRWDNTYDQTAKRSLLEILFRSLVGDNEQYLQELFCGKAAAKVDWVLRDAQGAIDGAEYTEAARGKPCGHIFRNGEATYHCKTCTNDPTCVLCSRCFEASDHRGHMVTIHPSLGNSGCCDCGDEEAWRILPHCGIHSAHRSSAAGKQPEKPQLPQDLLDSIVATIGGALDYFCDVMSCAPEELKKPKTEESITEDEIHARLLESAYDGPEEIESNPEYALVLWNDEKHSVFEVTEQIARACRQSKKFGREKANETDEVGRSFITASRNLPELLQMAKIIEQIKITVTIRSARDTFREQMCSTIIQWLLDIAGCRVGQDGDILTQTICDELLQPWDKGSQASNESIGVDGIHDHEIEEAQAERSFLNRGPVRDIAMNQDGGLTITMLGPETTDADDPDDVEEDDTQAQQVLDAMDVDVDAHDRNLNMTAGDVSDALRGEPEDSLENSEATLAGYPPPPPPPIGALRGSSNPTSSAGSAILTPPESIAGAVNIPIPQTPFSHARPRRQARIPWYWFQENSDLDQEIAPADDIRRRVRLDWMILYDLRLWKQARIDLRELYTSTVVRLPGFKRILGLRFAGLYTLLAQVYLIADREPDHSIIFLSLQMLTTHSIAKEVVDRCNFLTTLIAILYTFLTTRQVGYPMDVSATATLAFDAGSVTNRRMYHFFCDLKHLFHDSYVQEQLRERREYTLQFLDLIKLPQGICPNQRAVGEHVEYETDTWISASLLTREVNKLCRQFAEAFRPSNTSNWQSITDTIRTVTVSTVINCLGLEKERFKQAEIKHLATFHRLSLSDWEIDPAKLKPIVHFEVGRNSISFHHAMHYTLSWLIDGAKNMSAEDLRKLLTVKAQDLAHTSPPFDIMSLDPESFLMVLFDFPLRVCAWLAQMKASMWVRNGLSLRHQMGQYRSVNQRSLAHQHDIFLLQVAMVTCEPNRVLLSIVDRFGLTNMMAGHFRSVFAQGSPVPIEDIEDTQMIDIAEDFVHLLIILLSERTTLQPLESEDEQQAISIRRDLTHVLCFKPLSYSDLCQRIVDRYQELDEFEDILGEMTNYKAPEGLSDVGTFVLKQQYLANLDPYIAHYSKNQRDEADVVYRKYMAEQTGKPLAEVIFEPELRKITSGAFVGLSAFVGEPIFRQIIHYCLLYALESQQYTPSIPITRIESFLQVVLHLILLSVNEDPFSEDSMEDDVSRSFVHRLLTRTPVAGATFGWLYSLLARKDFEGCHAKIKLILLRMQQKRPKLFGKASEARGAPADRNDTGDTMDISNDDIQKKKKAESEARARRALAAMKQQAADFSQNYDWGSDLDDDESLSSPIDDLARMWEYPGGNCIYCQEECTDDRLYGTFAFIKKSTILRTTDTTDVDRVQEILELPESLDRDAESIRPFGLAARNREIVRKVDTNGEEIAIERQILGKGFRPEHSLAGPVSSSCGHIMHYNCFESYNNATIRRQTHQIARHHPERTVKMEFVCPLCKALGNTFLPIIWKGKERRYPGVLESESTFENWIADGVKAAAAKYGKMPDTSNPVGAMSITSSPQDQRTSVESLATGLSPFTAPRGLSMPGNFPDDIYSTSPPLESAQTNASGHAMTNVYFRLRESIRRNQLPSQFEYFSASDELSNSDSLAESLGHSIAAVEIAQRGVESGSEGVFVDKVSPVTMTHLRILSDMINSYISAGASQSPTSRVNTEIRQMVNKEFTQMFIGHLEVRDQLQALQDLTPALHEDSFNLLAECTLYLIPKMHISYNHVIRLCYMLEVVKNVYVVWRDAVTSVEHVRNHGVQPTAALEDEAVAFRQFLAWSGINNVDNLFERDPRFGFYAIRRIRPNLLTFLRKTALLVNITRGVDFSSAGFSDPLQPELERLTHAMQLPSVADMLRGAGTTQGESVVRMQAVVQGWIKHVYSVYRGEDAFTETGAAFHRLRVPHPVIFELVGLPKYYDTLMDAATRSKCPSKKKKEMMDPAVCLFCGELMCSQSVCCTEGGKGGCNRHMAKCGRGVGLFLNLRKCMVLYLHDESGSWAYCPYLDRHGEPDPGLRRNRQLMLNQKRYDALLRNVWLNHMIPTTISRKLEADINNGGWETL